MSNPEEARVVLKNVTTGTGARVLRALQTGWSQGHTVKETSSVRAAYSVQLGVRKRNITIKAVCDTTQQPHRCFAARSRKVLDGFPTSVPGQQIFRCTNCLEGKGN